jgi:hypothetical protein
MSRSTPPSPLLSTSASAIPAAKAVPCKDGTLVLSYDLAVHFQATGDRGDAFEIVSRGSQTCRLTGYPTVTLTDHRGARMPFHYTDGHSPYITKRPPQPVILTPGSKAYVGVAKYRCDLGDRTLATTIAMKLPGQHNVLSAPLPSRTLNLGYCEDGPHNPGNTVSISPIEPAADWVQY